MRDFNYRGEINVLLDREGALAVKDFMTAWPGVPKPTVYSRIHLMLQDGVLSQVGRGQYIATHKPVFRYEVSDWMREVNLWLIDHCEGVDLCMYEKGGNLHVEVYKAFIGQVVSILKKKYVKVILDKDEAAFPLALEGYIVVGPMVSDAPLAEVEDVRLPSLEKSLVDRIAESKKDIAPHKLEFQKVMEVYPVNVNRMMRYAARRGLKDELSDCISSLDSERLKMFSSLQRYLSGIPVLRAWVFGSFARGEETPESDLDLLVDYDWSSSLSLLDIVRFKLDLEKRLGREVDLVENGYLKPFAQPSAEREKYLVYEK